MCPLGPDCCGSGWRGRAHPLPLLPARFLHAQVCLTVRHVDGFALWPSKANNYTVAQSPWLGGNGDVVAQFTASAKRAGINACFYIIMVRAVVVTAPAVVQCA